MPPEVYSVLLGINPKTLTRPPSPPPVAQPKLRNDPFAIDEIDDEDRTAVFGKDLIKEHSWEECEEVVQFKASRNRIDQVDLEIGAFGGLKGFDVRLRSLGVEGADFSLDITCFGNYLTRSRTCSG